MSEPCTICGGDDAEWCAYAGHLRNAQYFAHVAAPRAEEPPPGDPPTLGQLVAAYKAACRGLDDWWKAHSPNETELAALAARLKAQPEVLATIERLNADYCMEGHSGPKA